MQEEVREALEASIKHWEENLAAEHPAQASVWGNKCALCQLFNYGTDEDCIHEDYGMCPVYEKTGENNCEESPWEDARAAYLRWNAYGNDKITQWKEAAQAELDFLCSLRED